MVRYPAVLLLLFSVGCATATPPQPQVAATKPAATPEPVASQPAAAEPAAAEPAATPATGPAPKAASTPPAPTGVKTPAPQAVRKAPAPVAATSKPVAPAQPVAPAVAASRPTAAVPTPAPGPTLDVEALKARLRATKAIGVFTKISLKNNVDDLMKQFTEHYQGKRPPMAELRLSYDLLMMKVLSLLQDGDPPLASAIVSSREAIWTLLANEKSFAALQI